MINQNAKTLLEISDTYNDLMEQKKATKKRGELKKIDVKLKEIRDYVMKLTTNIDNLVKEERKKLGENGP